MAQCRGKTQKGERCKREAVAGAAYCSMHAPGTSSANEEAEAGSEVNGDELSDGWKVALGFAVFGAIVLLALKRG